MADEVSPLVVINVSGDDHAEHNQSRLERVIVTQAERILDLLSTIGEQLMFDLAALRDAVANNTTVDQSVKALLDGLSKQISDMISNGTAGTAELQSLVDQINRNNDDLSTAVTENTPHADTPPADVPVVDGGTIPTDPGNVPADGSTTATPGDGTTPADEAVPPSDVPAPDVPADGSAPGPDDTPLPASPVS